MLACSIDGALCAPGDALIPVNDHALLYGDGVFEGLRFYNRQVFRLDAHLARLADSAAAICLGIPMDKTELVVAISAAIEASGLDNGYIRLVITRGSGSMGLDPRTCQRPRTIIIVDELVMVDPARRKAGVNCIIAATRRLSADQLDPRIKSLNYLNQIMGKLEAHAAGADEAIILNQQGRVAEGTADNVFVVKNGELLTPPTSEGALEGITRGTIIELARDQGMQVREVPLAPWDLFTADECFLTGTGAELIPVASISGRALNPCGPLFDKLRAAFTHCIEFETTGRTSIPGTSIPGTSIPGTSIPGTSTA